jgi:hypothetical protein
VLSGALAVRLSAAAMPLSPLRCDVAHADQRSRRYEIQIPSTPPITKNTIDDIDSCPAPHRLGMKLPPKLPTNPPTYVGPLRIKSLFGLLDG